MLLVPLNVLAMMPFARPFRWPYLVFTYLIPLLPLIVFWDGIVSMLRIYSPEQMRGLTESLQAADYVWETGRMRVGQRRLQPPAHASALWEQATNCESLRTGLLSRMTDQATAFVISSSAAPPLRQTEPSGEV